jgi:hypothetical protein
MVDFNIKANVLVQRRAVVAMIEHRENGAEVVLPLSTSPRGEVANVMTASRIVLEKVERTAVTVTMRGRISLRLVKPVNSTGQKRLLSRQQLL